MTEPIRYTCPSCGWVNNHAPHCVFRARVPSADQRCLLAAYVDLRRDCIAIEELIEHSSDFTSDDLKRLDKAVTVMKVGFKMVKKVLRAQAIDGLKRWREPTATEVAETPNV